MKKMLAALLLIVGPACAWADGRTYAVMSIVGDGLDVVFHRAGTGSSVDRNVHERMALDGAAFDRVALSAVDKAIREVDPSAKTLLLAGGVPAALEAQSHGVVDEAALQKVVDALRPGLPAVGATHLILVTKHRAAAMLQLARRTTGSGTLDGLGFYVDQDLVVRRAGTNEKGRGFLAPYAYFSVALVDLTTGRLVREEFVRASTTRSAARSPNLEAWGALSDEDKVRTIASLIRDETMRVMPALLAAP